MDRMLYTAAAGATRTLEAQSIRANNLANAETTGFRADLERVEAKWLQPTGDSLPTRVLAQTQSADFSQQYGQVNTTGRTLDVALRGEGFLAVQTPVGEAYTRNGAIEPDAEGRLTINGFPVVGVDGPIVLPEFRELFVGNDGRISALTGNNIFPEEVGQLKLVNPEYAEMQKGLNGMMYTQVPAVLSDEVTIDSGFLESSNVQAVNELIASMDLTRQFEVQVKLMKSAEQMAQAGNKLLRNS
ncbi:flagellar basal body rod protein FlgF [Shewanella sp. 202IG2-18]|uniref:flagellar basal body rod protein FlgF n=1 Tax=Parashewanella hymeniacidonis TaxID=2807618 RepID=UPI001960FF84|nr:flagellar basal body rod protein FlgF [Parashewanella hymeniacidonis]MBM7072859.1 flagellar basal body rod protein FlgF [Parashewanella hymeniacidonis]